MAIQLDGNYKGVTANYWRINHFVYDDINDSAVVHLWLYISQDTCLSNKEANALERLVLKFNGLKNTQIPQIEGVTSIRDILKTLLYTIIMTPKMESYVVTEAEYDEEGNVTVPAVTGERQTNKFADGIVC